MDTPPTHQFTLDRGTAVILHNVVSVRINQLSRGMRGPWSEATLDEWRKEHRALGLFLCELDAYINS